jgi:pimeloyl-ACP methyl ester carboxylesterase
MSKTIMFVHGAWVTPACWTSFKSFFEAKGYTCLAPAWPYLDAPVATLKEHIDPKFADVTIKDLVDHFARKIQALPEPPILIGHSFGGLIVQLLLDRGLGQAGIAIDAGPPKGVMPSWTAIKSALPVLLSWQGWTKLHTMSLRDFGATFANGLPADDMQKAYDAQIVQASGRIYFQAALGIGNSLDFANPRRAPLLLIAGADDRTSTPSMVQAMYRRHKKSPRPVAKLEFPGRSHWLIAAPGWEEVAGGIYAWLQSSGEQGGPTSRLQ